MAWNPNEISITDHVTLKIIQPNYIHDIQGHINAKNSWKCVSISFETTSKVLLGCSTVLSFAAGVYIDTTLSFISGSVSTLSLVCMQFANFSKRESKRSTEELNILLKKIHVESIPDESLELSSSLKRSDTT